MRNLQKVLVPLALAAAAVSSAQAGVVMSAASVLSAPTTIGGFTFARTIDQSGLTIGYVSGVTDFATYISGAPRHVGSNSPENYAATNATVGPVDYDMGASVGLLQLAFWNYPFSSNGPVLDFDILTSDDANFGTSTLAGSFIVANDGSSIGPPGNAVQVFDLLDSTARYVRFTNISLQSNAGFGWSEVAFDVGASAVPEPGTLALVLGGFAGLLIRRNRPR